MWLWYEVCGGGVKVRLWALGFGLGLGLELLGLKL